MATLKGPSFSGPRTGWTAATIVPQSQVAATAPTQMSQFLANRERGVPLLTPAVGGGGGGGGLSQYNLSDDDFGGDVVSRQSAYRATPLESLLSAMFPDAAADFNPNRVPSRSSGPPPSLLNTILGNLGGGGFGGGQVAAPVYQPPGIGAQIASTIPGAPPFLAGAIDRVSGAGVPVAAAPAAGAGLGGLSGVAAISAEQRIQQAEMQKARAQAQADWFKSQQKIQQDSARRQQMQRQRMSPVSGWSRPITF